MITDAEMDFDVQKDWKNRSGGIEMCGRDGGAIMPYDMEVVDRLWMGWEKGKKE